MDRIDDMGFLSPHCNLPDSLNGKTFLLYAIINDEGCFFVPNGMGQYNSTWHSDIKKAKIYPGIGQAKSVANQLKQKFPNKPTPQVLKLSCYPETVIDLVDHVTQANIKKEKREKDLKLKALNEKKRALLDEISRLENE